MPTGHLILGQNSFMNKEVTSNPTISYFQLKTENHTEFSIEDMEQYFVNEYGFAKRSTCILHSNGDLINNTYLCVTLPKLPYIPKYGFSWRWIENIGFNIIKKIDIEINNKIIQSFSGIYLNAHFDKLNNKTKKTEILVGNIPKLTKFSMYKDEYKLYVPIPFWYAEEYGNSLPIGKIGNDKVKINVEFNNIEKMIEYGPTHYLKISEESVDFDTYEAFSQYNTNAMGIFFYFDADLRIIYFNLISDTSFQMNSNAYNSNLIGLLNKDSMFLVNEKKNKIYTPLSRSEQINQNVLLNYDISSAYVLTTYIFLGLVEQEVIKKRKKIEYISKEVQVFEFKDLETTKGVFPIYAKNSVYELYWVGVSKGGFDILECVNKNALYVNGFDILSKRDTVFVDNINHFIYYPEYNDYKKNVNMYSYALYPTKYQPSGTLNMSKIEKYELSIDFINLHKNVDFYIFVKSYNILNISEDNVSLLF